MLTAAEPQLFVADVTASCDYFVRKLGFAVVFVHGEPPFYGQVARDGARLDLRCVAEPVVDPAERDRQVLLSAAMTVRTAAEIHQLYSEFQSAGAFIVQSLQAQPWGATNFIVRDLDGNLLLFAGPTV